LKTRRRNIPALGEIFNGKMEIPEMENERGKTRILSFKGAAREKHPLF